MMKLDGDHRLACSGTREKKILAYPTRKQPGEKAGSVRDRNFSAVRMRQHHKLPECSFYYLSTSL